MHRLTATVWPGLTCRMGKGDEGRGEEEGLHAGNFE